VQSLEEERTTHFARFCWRNRTKLTPKRNITWGRLFEEMSGESLDSFARRKKDEQNTSQESSSEAREKV